MPCMHGHGPSQCQGEPSHIQSSCSKSWIQQIMSMRTWGGVTASESVGRHPAYAHVPPVEWPARACHCSLPSRLAALSSRIIKAGSSLYCNDPSVKQPVMPVTPYGNRPILLGADNTSPLQKASDETRAQPQQHSKLQTFQYVRMYPDTSCTS